MTGAPESKDARPRFQSESDPEPDRIEIATDATRAEEALRRMRAGTHLLYRGDERNARQLFAALQRRVRKRRPERAGVPVRELFHRERAARLEEHRLLSRLLLEIDGAYRLALTRGSDVAAACEAAWGAADGEARLVPFRELLGVVGAYEWQRRGIGISGLGRVHPRYGVFAPTRPSYVDLFAEAPAPIGRSVLDIGTGTGVLALVAARRGARRVTAIDADPRAVACAKGNVERFGLGATILVREGDLFADERADLYVFNPPWLPGQPRTPIERAIFDPAGTLLERYLAGLGERLGEGDEGWLLMSDLAERLELRAPGEIEARARHHGLDLAWVRSRKAADAPSRRDAADPISRARADETVLLRCFVRAPCDEARSR